MKKIVITRDPSGYDPEGPRVNDPTLEACEGCDKFFKLPNRPACPFCGLCPKCCECPEEDAS